jgi:hypothetical protein
MLGKTRQGGLTCEQNGQEIATQFDHYAVFERISHEQMKYSRRGKGIHFFAQERGARPGQPPGVSPYGTVISLAIYFAISPVFSPPHLRPVPANISQWTLDDCVKYVERMAISHKAQCHLKKLSCCYKTFEPTVSVEAI